MPNGRLNGAVYRSVWSTHRPMYVIQFMHTWSAMGTVWLWEALELQTIAIIPIITHWLSFIGYFYSTTL